MLTHLHNLFTETTQRSTSPTERFIAGGLVALLNENEEIKSVFLQDVIQMNISEAVIKAEVLYPEDDCLVDIEIAGFSTLIFIKLNIDTKQDENQLWKYHILLNKLKRKHNDLEVRLINLTKDYVKGLERLSYARNRKLVINRIFWSQVCEMLCKFSSSNALVDSYLQFLNELRLGAMREMTKEDLQSLTLLPDLYEMVHGMMEVIKSEFLETFEASLFNQLKVKKRWIILNKSVIKGKGYSEIGLGIYLRSTPCIRAHIYVSKYQDQYNEIASYAYKYYDQEYVEQTREGLAIKFEQTLIQLVGDKSPKDRLVAITKDLLDEVKVVIRDSPHIKWNLSKF
ncbi:hypothetical protein [Fodinibius halophilus]|uniref:Uncharacterized protein n=1 Tax=Fodinibius halophilus TaxID=1736908 RepID=A0A6M1T0Q3_9BACT|nr:hypothetical protein [Fodinibius halophilus]NGP89678.1 hypothetical protein [Fodinibius halophilus]